MFLYYVRLAALSYRRNPILSSLMVLAVAIGVGAYMVVFTLNYVLGGDPIPHKSSQLYHVQFEYGDPDIADFEPPPQLTYRDAMVLLEQTNDVRRTVSSKFVAVLEPPGNQLQPFFINGRGSSADFFAMFDVPFLYGNAWSRTDDQAQQQVAVLSREMNDRLFGGQNSVGETLQMHGLTFQIIGVLDRWQPTPMFYDVNNGPIGTGEEIYIPWGLIASQQLRRSGNTNCWAAPENASFEAFLNAECAWVQFWVELPDQQVFDDYSNFIDNYSAQQKEFGRMPLPPAQRLYDVNEWMVKNEVQPDETRILSALAAMLMAVCLLNTVGLLLAKFLGKSGEIGVRQALGANRRSLFIQHTIEAGFIGALGGILGLGVSALGLEGIKILLGNEIPHDWVVMNLPVVGVTITLAIISTILAGLYPIWRASTINPAIHLKTQ
ncbi:ABC transporter permease [Pseudohongiella spirulinae]|uniref:ABC-type transport system, involved in lipoprotein release, permease component n=1 Tax=Pseudohongiella spirulinae TaxID=1249552 RepID=A0A0S2KGP4_9GAMM|nr:ABC transporter permease [Pseudohongiella spirulinae]ALO47489.1 ABC-type transport system, involved in lipoprotein release, permease component [Pseudohongiella spirulinae]